MSAPRLKRDRRTDERRRERRGHEILQRPSFHQRTQSDLCSIRVYSVAARGLQLCRHPIAASGDHGKNILHSNPAADISPPPRRECQIVIRSDLRHTLPYLHRRNMASGKVIRRRYSKSEEGRKEGSIFEKVDPPRFVSTVRRNLAV